MPLMKLSKDTVLQRVILFRYDKDPEIAYINDERFFDNLKWVNLPGNTRIKLCARHFNKRDEDVGYQDALEGRGTHYERRLFYPFDDTFFNACLQWMLDRNQTNEEYKLLKSGKIPERYNERAEQMTLFDLKQEA